MLYDLRTVRESLGLSVMELSEILGLSQNNYMRFEKEGELPCKYIYLLREKTKEKDSIPFPDDFFHYTSTTLKLSMVYNRINEPELCRRLGWRQSTLSAYLCGEPMAMYELKDDFDKAFETIVLPYVVKDGKPVLDTDLSMRGNFVTAKRRKEYVRQRIASGLSVEEYKKQHRMMKREAVS